MSEPWRNVALSELLPTEAIEELVALANEGRYHKADLMPVLERYRAELEAKGVLADYLGYVLEHTFGQMIEANEN